MIIIPTMSGALARTAPAADYRSAVMADSPVSYWRLGEANGTTAVDEVGAYPGDYSGTFTLGVAGAIAGNTAVSFPGVYGIMIGSPQAALSYSQKCTIEGWVSRALGTNQIFGFTLSGNYLLGIEWYSDSIYLYCYSGAMYYGYFTANVAGWHHVALVFDGSLTGNARLAGYLDGSPVALSYVGTAPATLPHSGNLGYFGAGRGLSFARNTTGVLDELAVYSKALSASRIAAHYAAR